MSRLAGRELSSAENDLLQQGRLLLQELEASPTFQQLKAAVLKIVDKIRAKLTELEAQWDEAVAEDKAISTGLLEVWCLC